METNVALTMTFLLSLAFPEQFAKAFLGVAYLYHLLAGLL